MKYMTKRKYNKKNRKYKKTRRNYLLCKKNKCVKFTIKSKNTKKYKGGATTYMPSTSNVTLPIVIDKNQVTYSCTPVPTS